MTWGRERKPEKALQTSTIEGRSVGSRLQHFLRNSQTASSITSKGCRGVSPACVFWNALASLDPKYGIFPVNTWEINVRFDPRARRYRTVGTYFIGDHTNSVHIALFRYKNFIHTIGFGRLNFRR